MCKINTKQWSKQLCASAILWNLIIRLLYGIRNKMSHSLDGLNTLNTYILLILFPQNAYEDTKDNRNLWNTDWENISICMVGNTNNNNAQAYVRFAFQIFLWLEWSEERKWYFDIIFIYINECRKLFMELFICWYHCLSHHQYTDTNVKCECRLRGWKPKQNHSWLLCLLYFELKIRFYLVDLKNFNAKNRWLWVIGKNWNRKLFRCSSSKA